MNIADYKNIAIKKKAKEKIGTHFGLLCDLWVIALHGKCKIIINIPLLTTAGSRPAARPHPGRTTGSCVARAAHLARMCGLPCAAAHAAHVSLHGYTDHANRPIATARWLLVSVIDQRNNKDELHHLGWYLDEAEGSTADECTTNPPQGTSQRQNPLYDNPPPATKF